MRHANYRVRKDLSKRLLRHPLLTGLALISVYCIGFFWFISYKQTTTEKRPKKLGSQIAPSEVRPDDEHNEENFQKEKNTRVGEMIDVTKDNVHVRRKPVDGLILGKVSREDRVVFIERKQKWCHVKTPNNHQGWMICDALAF